MKKIFWIDSKWLSSDEIQFPFNDRGLNLSDGIFETILIIDKKPQLLKQHLNRWNTSANELGMAPPPTEESLIPLIEEAISRASLASNTGALRINWSRGESTNRGINISDTNKSRNTHTFWLELNEYMPSFHPIKTLISRDEKRNADSKLSKLKTFNYLQSIQARKESHLAGFDDAILLSTNGEISCGTTANLIVKRKEEWLTPRLESGCLPGIMRQQGLDAGFFKEAEISAQPNHDDNWLLINSLSCHSITRLNDFILKKFQEPEMLWKSLLKDNNN